MTRQAIHVFGLKTNSGPALAQELGTGEYAKRAGELIAKRAAGCRIVAVSHAVHADGVSIILVTEPKPDHGYAAGGESAGETAGA